MMDQTSLKEPELDRDFAFGSVAAETRLYRCQFLCSVAFAAFRFHDQHALFTRTSRIAGRQQRFGIARIL